MRKQFLLLTFLLASGLLFTSCGATSSESSSTDSSSTSTETYTKKLHVYSLPDIVDYSQYNQLDLTGLVVKEKTLDSNNKTVSSEIIDDYSLTWEDTDKVAVSGQYLSSIGSFKIIVSKDGCVSDDIPITVASSSDFSQFLTVTSKPTTTLYDLNSSFDATGLEVTLTTSYVDSDSKKHKGNTILSSKDYSLTIGDDNELAKNFTFTTYDSQTVTITYVGLKVTLTASFIAYVKQANVTEPAKIVDDTMSWKEDSEKMTVNIKNDAISATADTDKGYYSPTEVGDTFTAYDVGQNNYSNCRYTPSTGEVPTLVVPLIMPGYESEATSTVWNNIYTSFLGDSADITFESLHSYYYQSSFGKLDFTGTMTDYCTPSDLNSSFAKLEGFESTLLISSLAALVGKWVKSTYGFDMSKFDTDSDGTIDSLWMIYVGPDYNVNSTFWAFTASTLFSGTVADPVVNMYSWAGYNFITDVPKYENLDARTLIHETGHQLGLSDYYSYNNSVGYDAVGYIDMMDTNIGDHCSYSKLLLGWIKPYIVYGSDVTLTINSCQSQDSVIVIPYDGKTYQKDSEGKVIFNAYDEFLVLDYYSDSNFNGTDNHYYNTYHIKGNGGRLYHVDNRLAHVASNKLSIYDDPDDAMTGSNLYEYFSNTFSGDHAEYFKEDRTCDLIRRISADGKYMSKSNSATTSTLFAADSTFSVASFKSQFVNGALDSKVYDNKEKTQYHQKACNYSFTVNSIA